MLNIMINQRLSVVIAEHLSAETPPSFVATLNAFINTPPRMRDEQVVMNV